MLKEDKALNKNWTLFVEKLQEKKIVCYGAGVNATLMLMNEKFQEFIPQVCFFVDMDPAKEGGIIKSPTIEFNIYSINKLDEIDKETVVIVTISDYVNVGKMLDEKGISWFAWTVVSTSSYFQELELVTDRNKPKMFLLNTPDYINLGDHAIAVAEDIYIKENFGKYYEFGTHSCHPEALEYLRQYVSHKDIIFFQGGGNLGSLWRVCEEIFRDVLKKFPDNTVIVFPQSVYYGDDEEEQQYFLKSKELYNAHKKLLICVRDQRSYDFVKKEYNCECLLLPDIVLTLDSKAKRTRQGIGVLLRNDKEKLLPNDYKYNIESVVEALEEPLITITHHPMETLVNRHERIKKILEEYASCKLVITDRLHGMIFSAITNTPCIVFDNNYHKVSGVYKAWLKEYEHISYVEALSKEELLELAQEKISRQYADYNVKEFRDKFAILTKYIKNLI